MGKSTVLHAAQALRWLGTDSSPRSMPLADIGPYEPFLLDEESEKNPISLGCDVYFDGSILRYEIEYEKKSILSEQMILLDGKTEAKLIDRTPSGKVSGDLIKRRRANRLYVKKMQPNVTVLSKLCTAWTPRGGRVHPSLLYRDQERNTSCRLLRGGRGVPWG